ncbi:aminomethyl-transferring glycine dehydrogenase subunit GcvPB [Puniceicoccales bacterium CK1056]|uniref:glycine dehydrogenase (aminomethyl-transferring) n=1 Tax=Oceanipulchritudo coccoides TaxID=2706888 RepID=A0A6B2M2R8_9BACT|nr:aminomethyl-transferring glycine dehydrogenase subunit GcvPB [Oceanipulchritudo coccoides]NDV62000.1 aminomethyl-transferring glycine dehydrogenase subunit GcvPB [Oceanipulchritudo coccoides]
MSQGQSNPLPFNPESLPRETLRHYISASEGDIKAMLDKVGADSLEALYQHIPGNCLFPEAPDLPEELSYEELQSRLVELAAENRPCESYIGDGLPNYAVMPVVDPVCAIRNLTTAYTPYQPERSQGTLTTHWIYQCMMSQLTGFEAINSSLYERSTATFEAMATAVRVSRKADQIIISEGIYPGDREVIETLLPGTGIQVKWVPLDRATGRTDLSLMRAALEEGAEAVAGIVFPQVNCLGLLEDVDALADLTLASKTKSIAVIDPALLGTGGLKPPTEYGQKGVDMIVGEAQHLAIGPNFGGPGLGLFGVRHNEENKNTIRQTPGRYVGKAKDISGRDCLVMVLSTREQHIRKDKATSNICSNQAFLATIAGAAILSRGESGMQKAFSKAREQALEAVEKLSRLKGIQLAFPESTFVNEILLSVDGSVPELIEAARQASIHLGVDISDRIEGKGSLLKMSFSDREMDLDRLLPVFEQCGYVAEKESAFISDLATSDLRSGALGLPEMEDEEIIKYYQSLGELNVSPDDACYPLGSCTMKYNPFINDWAASLPGFTDIHPQAPLEDAQGSLHLLYEIQEWFKEITGLAGITTQPVAGAQGELVGIKLFQAYHEDRGEGHRDVILIPASAHGTNFATAVMAGYRTKKVDGLQTGIVLLESAPDGSIDMEDFRAKVEIYKDRLAGVMITNPNTCGIFETCFAEISKLVHDAGGLVYMDGANMNAIAGWCDLGAMGVDAVHNNLHKTWTIPHGGGGPGDAIVGVSERLVPFLPGFQIEKREGAYVPVRTPKSIGSFHRHWGNFAHKVRAYTYLLRLGKEGVRRMTAVAVLSARYCFEQLREAFPTLPADAVATPRMHEFILTLSEEDFVRLEQVGVPRALVITRVGKLFLDFGFHAPTVAWPETFGLMIEPTESYSKSELDRFCEAVLAMLEMIRKHPEVLAKVPLFTPVDRVDEVEANRHVTLKESLTTLPEPHRNRLSPTEIGKLPISEVFERIVEASRQG